MTTATKVDRKLVTKGEPDERFPAPTDEAFKDEQDELQDFLEAPTLDVIGRALLKARPELSTIGEFAVVVAFRWKLAGGATGGKLTLGKCVKLSGLAAHFSEGTHYVVWLAADHLRQLKMTRWQVEALLFHELSHVKIELGEQDGDAPKLKTRGHDFDGFCAEIEHYGLWQADLVTASETIMKAQQTFAFDGDEA